jgi:ABC-type transport system substrate-binding protein
MSHRYEYAYLAPKIQQLNGPLNTTRLFNAALSMIDDKGAPIPYLAESLPQLNTDAWRVFPDGRMETTYRLRANLTWQDGAPLTADDFVFAYRVYKESGVPAFSANPQDAMDWIAAPDPRTIVIGWKSLSSVGGSLGFEDFDPLPKHLLETLVAGVAEGRVTPEGFLASPLWSSEYVGAGPFRLDRWEPGVALNGSAFDGHSLGRPKIDRIIVRIFVDENMTLTSIMAGGQLGYSCCNTIRFEQYARAPRSSRPGPPFT